MGYGVTAAAHGVAPLVVVVNTGLACRSVYTLTGVGEAESNKQLLQRIFDAWAGGDIRPLIEAMSDGFRWTFPGEWEWAGTWSGKDSVVNGLLRGAIGPQLDGPFELHADLVLADGDRVVVQARGRGQTLRGQPYNNTYCMIFRVHDGQLTEVIEHCDTALVERVLEPPV